jgi:hypothetical protein
MFKSMPKISVLKIVKVVTTPAVENAMHVTVTVSVKKHLLLPIKQAIQLAKMCI